MLKTTKHDKAPSQISTFNYDQEIALEKAKWMHTAKRLNNTEPISNQTLSQCSVREEMLESRQLHMVDSTF